MNKKTLPILILLLIVIACVAILAANLASPAAVPAPAASTSSMILSASPTQDQLAGTTTIVSAVAVPPKPVIIAVKAPNGVIRAEVASTSLQQAQGLGDRTSLLADQGMLFPFTYPGDYGFWMKDMRFPLDMVWISSDKRVVSVLADLSPDTYPAVFYPPLAISYVLELNAGAAKEFSIATDTQLVF